MTGRSSVLVAHPGHKPRLSASRSACRRCRSASSSGRRPGAVLVIRLSSSCKPEVGVWSASSSRRRRTQREHVGRGAHLSKVDELRRHVGRRTGRVAAGVDLRSTACAQILPGQRSAHGADRAQVPRVGRLDVQVGQPRGDCRWRRDRTAQLQAQAGGRRWTVSTALIEYRVNTRGRALYVLQHQVPASSRSSSACSTGPTWKRGVPARPAESAWASTMDEVLPDDGMRGPRWARGSLTETGAPEGDPGSAQRRRRRLAPALHPARRAPGTRRPARTAPTGPAGPGRA